jgi:hypothetical protein
MQHENNNVSRSIAQKTETEKGTCQFEKQNYLAQARGCTLPQSPWYNLWTLRMPNYHIIFVTVKNITWWILIFTASVQD